MAIMLLLKTRGLPKLAADQVGILIDSCVYSILALINASFQMKDEAQRDAIWVGDSVLKDAALSRVADARSKYRTQTTSFCLLILVAALCVGKANNRFPLSL